jgi:hypothetical protein
VYEVLARDGPGFTLAHCWSHTKRKYDEIATNWPTACAEIGELIGEAYATQRVYLSGLLVLTGQSGGRTLGSTNNLRTCWR